MNPFCFSEFTVFIATFAMDDWVVILGIHALVVAMAVVFGDKLIEAKFSRFDRKESKEQNWQGRCESRLDTVERLANALAQQNSYLTGLVRMLISECKFTASFPGIASTNRSFQTGVERSAAEMRIFSNDATERQAAVQILAHQVGNWDSCERIRTASTLFPEDKELQRGTIDLKRRLENLSS